MRFIRFVGPLVLLCQIAGAQSGVAQAPIAALPIGDPDAAGVSRERLERVMLLLDGEVKAGRIAGAVGPAIVIACAARSASSKLATAFAGRPARARALAMSHSRRTSPELLAVTPMPVCRRPCP